VTLDVIFSFPISNLAIRCRKNYRRRKNHARQSCGGDTRIAAAYLVPEMTPVYSLKVTGSFMGISERVFHWAFGTVLLANPSRGIRPELTHFRDFAGI